MPNLYYRFEDGPTDDGVTWLSIESSEFDDGSVYFYYFGEKGGTPFCYDDWCISRDDAFEGAEHEFGLTEDSWHTGDYYEEKGFELPS